MRLQIEDRLEDIASSIKRLSRESDYVLSQLDGTAKTYKMVMRKWFYDHGVNVVTEEGLTKLVDEWYEITKTGWDGGTRFYQPDVNSISTGDKVGDNEGLTCEPSTNDTAGRDDYAGLPLFACVDCNFIVNPTTLEPVVTAINGITSNFTRYDDNVFVGVLQQAGYIWQEETDQTYTYGYCDLDMGTHGNITPLPESVRASDNSTRSWVVHGKYANKTVDNKLTCRAGLTPTCNVSHNSIQTLAKATGSQYSGWCACDWSFLVIMTMIKYGQMTLDNTIQGCVSYSYQYYAKVAEEGITRVLVTENEGKNILIGSTMLVGNYENSLDRSNAGMRSISGWDGFVVAKKESVTIEDTTYTAIYFDTDTTFDTANNGDKTEGTTYITTWHWRTGSCDNILGNDGSPGNPKTGQYLAKLQGIEFSYGGYQIFTDTILSEDGEKYNVYTVNRSANQATSVTDNYVKSKLTSANPENGAWCYIRKLSYDGQLFFGTDTTGGSSSTYTKDAFYKDKAGTTGLREWLCFGYLGSGVAYGGLSCLNGYHGLSYAYWICLARLSPNGNRGLTGVSPV